MIKRILILLIFILFPCVVFSKISTGLKTGLNLSYAKYSDKEAESSKINADALTNRIVSFGTNILFID